MRFLAVFEKTETGYSAYIPDLPGCMAAGGTLDETRCLLQEGAGFHLQAMLRDNEVLPKPRDVIEVPVSEGAVGIIEVEIDQENPGEALRA